MVKDGKEDQLLQSMQSQVRNMTEQLNNNPEPHELQVVVVLAKVKTRELFP